MWDLDAQFGVPDVCPIDPNENTGQISRIDFREIHTRARALSRLIALTKTQDGRACTYLKHMKLTLRCRQLENERAQMVRDDCY